MAETLEKRAGAILSRIADAVDFRRVAAETLRGESSVVVSGLPGATRALFVAGLWQTMRRPLVLVTAHDAFGYFCIAFDLKSMPLKGVSTEEEVSIGRMDEVINFIVDHQIKAVFVESAVAPQIVKALIEPCSAKGQEVTIGGELYADALGPAGSGADSYLGMFKANVDTIVSALK